MAVGAFHLAYEWEIAGGLVAVYLVALYSLAWVRTARWAFYLGLAIGFAVTAPQLSFFVTVFGSAAIGLWLTLALWTAFYLLLAHLAVQRYPRVGAAWLPVLWFALEYFRSELYYLKFAWLTPGFALTHPNWQPFLVGGVYGFSLFVLMLVALIDRTTGQKRLIVIAVSAVVLGVVWFRSPDSSLDTGVEVVGIQLEGSEDFHVLEALDDAVKSHPRAEMFVLSEYTFDGPIPSAVGDWCERHQKYLVAGGKENVPGSEQFYDTIFVLAPTGETVFQQAKSVPIQFFNDGLPAKSQRLWESPWGNIGIGICYDLSYSRVTDRLVSFGAQALIIPAVDLKGWGEHEHRLHAKIAPVRASEYGIPIFRVASSGISQLVNEKGRTIATASFPGQGDIISGVLPIGESGHLPLDRFLAMPAVVSVLGLLVFWAVTKIRLRSWGRS